MKLTRTVLERRKPLTSVTTVLILMAIPCLAQSSAPAQSVDSIIGKFAQPNMPGCAVSVVQNGSVVTSGAFGLADVENGTKNTIQTRFDIGSMTKQFVAMAVLKAASEGKLSLTEDVHRYIPELPRYKWKITLLDLLHHTSGLKDYEELLKLAGWAYGDLVSVHDVLWIVERQKDLAFEPGTRMMYSNTNYYLLGFILQRVFGKPLANILRDQVFHPLGMENTSLRTDPWALLDGKKAWPYLISNGRPSLLIYREEALGAGGVFSTAEDLARWEQNLDSPTFEADIIAKLKQVLPLRNGTANEYAAGLYIRSVNGLRLIEHPGGIAGYLSDKLYFPERHLSVMALCNRRDNTDVAVTNELASHFLGVNLIPEAPAFPHPSSKAVLQRVAGVYFADSVADGFQIEARDGAVVDTGTEREYRQVGPWTFESSPAGTFCRCSTTYVFEFDENGKVRGLRATVPAGTGASRATEYRYMPAAHNVRISDYTGEYVSEDVAATWCLLKKDDALYVRRRGFADGELQFLWDDVAGGPADGPDGILQFERKNGTVSGFSFRNPRFNSVSFRKLPPGQEPVPAPTECPAE